MAPKNERNKVRLEGARILAQLQKSSLGLDAVLVHR